MFSSCIYTERIFTGQTAQSLVWSGDDLVDWAGGGARYHADGTISARRVIYSFAFDAAITEPLGEFAVIYTRLGTKALLLRHGKIIRELNRSFYHADDYEYPIALVRHGERTLLVHCPHDYNKLEIEDAATGEVLTARTSEPADFFHSRLAASPGGRYLLSAGWVWHPWDAVVYYDLEEALRRPEHLDITSWAAPDSHLAGFAETSSAAWSGENEVLLGASAEPDDPIEPNAPDEKHLRSRGIVSYDLRERTIRSACVLDEPAGTMMPVGSTHVMAFRQCPRLIRLADGFVEFSLPWISSGTQVGSILLGLDLPPPLALDPERQRFAIAQGDKVHVVSIVLSDMAPASLL